MKQPRRIFRHSTNARPRRISRIALLWTLGALGAAGMVVFGLSPGMFGRVQPMPDHVQADPGQVAVVDGDTLQVGGHIVRLAGVDAPERGDRCSGGADCGGAATTALAGLVRDRRVQCRLSGHDRLGRPYGTCDANGTDLSRAIVAAGWARAQPETPGLADLELRARRQGAGLWASALTQ